MPIVTVGAIAILLGIGLLSQLGQLDLFASPLGHFVFGLAIYGSIIALDRYERNAPLTFLTLVSLCTITVMVPSQVFGLYRGGLLEAAVRVTAATILVLVHHTWSRQQRDPVDSIT